MCNILTRFHWVYFINLKSFSGDNKNDKGMAENILSQLVDDGWMDG